MIEISTEKQVQEYFDSPNLSQSKLKKLLKGFDNFIAEDEDISDKDFIKIGSAVDLILTGNEEEFENKFYISQLLKLPSEKLRQIVDIVYQEVLKNNLTGKLEDYFDMILIATEEVEYYLNRAAKTRVAGVIKEGASYFDELVDSEGKTIISAEQHDQIAEIVQSLRTDPKTKQYFDKMAYKSDQSIKVMYQFPAYFTYKGIDCKALLDIAIFILEEDKLVSIIPIDLKTMHGNTLDFPAKIAKYRYDIQAAWYKIALEILYPNIPILDFLFIVESSSKPGNPLVYEIRNDSQRGLKGIPPVYDGKNFLLRREVKGVKQLMKEFLYYVDQGWRGDVRSFEFGIISLGDNDIKY